jgi:membrane protein DedA with SNARE-associated domain
MMNILSILSDLFSTLVLLVKNLGYLGIFIGMMIESTVFPLPGEIILIPAGALIAQGHMSFLPVILIAVAGTIAGALINFFFAMFLGRGLVNILVKKYGKFMFITERRLAGIDNFFMKHGEITTFIGRLVPVVRHLISLPAGFSKMNVFKFAFYTALGSLISSSVSVFLGYVFWDRLEWIHAHMNLLYIILFAIAAATAAVYILVRRNHNSRK